MPYHSQIFARKPASGHALDTNNGSVHLRMACRGREGGNTDRQTRGHGWHCKCSEILHHREKAQTHLWTDLIASLTLHAVFWMTRAETLLMAGAARFQVQMDLEVLMPLHILAPIRFQHSCMMNHLRWHRSENACLRLKISCMYNFRANGASSKPARSFLMKS